MSVLLSSIGHVFLARHVAVTARRGFVLRPRRASHSCSVAPISPDARPEIVQQFNRFELHADHSGVEQFVDVRNLFRELRNA